MKSTPCSDGALRRIPSPGPNVRPRRARPVRPAAADRRGAGSGSPGSRASCANRRVRGRGGRAAAGPRRAGALVVIPGVLPRNMEHHERRRPVERQCRLGVTFRRFVVDNGPRRCGDAVGSGEPATDVDRITSQVGDDVLALAAPRRRTSGSVGSSFPKITSPVGSASTSAVDSSGTSAPFSRRQSNNATIRSTSLSPARREEVGGVVVRARLSPGVGHLEVDEIVDDDRFDAVHRQERGVALGLDRVQHRRRQRVGERDRPVVGRGGIAACCR